MCNKIGTLVKLQGDLLEFIKTRCRSWNCPDCSRFRRRRLIAEAQAGKPNRFITLTVNPAWHDSPDERAAALSRSWRGIVQAFRHRWPGRESEYLAVFEETKRGEPHLHIMWRGAFMPVKWLSAQMLKRMGAPVVDIRLVRDKTQVAKYVFKYISKRNIKFGTCKRYWSSKSYLPKKKDRNNKGLALPIIYWVTKRHPIDYMAWLVKRGISVTCHSPRHFSCNMPPGDTHPPWFWIEEHVGVKYPVGWSQRSLAA